MKEGTQMNKMRRLVSALLAVCLIVVMVPVSVSAASSGTCGDDLTWTLSDDGVLTISSTGPMNDYESWGDNRAPWYNSRSAIKSVVIEDGVTSIGNYAFHNCSALTSITIPDSVTSIGQYAFDSCRALTSVTIPDSVTSIGDYAFYECARLASVTIPNGVTSIGNSVFAYCEALTSITIPDSVTSIGNSAFYYCPSLTSITIPNSVTSIGYSAFSCCRALTSVTIPASVTSLGNCVFGYCNALTAIYVDENNAAYSSDSLGVLFSKNKTELVQVPGGYQGHYSVPDSVISIGDSAFYNCYALTSVTIPDSVTSIGNSAFKECYRLTNVTIPDSVTSIGNSAFAYCEALTSVTISDSVTSIGEAVFKSCSALASITIPDSVTSIGDSAFYSCHALTNVTIGNSVTSIGTNAFVYCFALTSVIIPDSVSSIDTGAFYMAGLTHVHIGNGVTAIGEYAFAYCETLTSVTIPDSVTSIGEAAFSGCESLASVTIPDSVTSIGDYAFSDCESLASVTIPDSVTSIGEYTFGSCTALTEITFLGNAPSIDSVAFNGVTATAYYPANDATWTTDVMQNYGGTLTWVPYEVNPEAPTVKIGNVASSGKVKLNWNAVEGATEYQIYRATAKDGLYKLIKTATSTTFVNTSAKAGTTYYYYVVAVDADGNASDESNIVSRTCDLAQPVISVSNVASTGKVKISWNAVDGATGYIICTYDADGNRIKAVTVSKTSVIHNSGEAGVAYTYKVRAKCAVDSASSAYSDAKTRMCDLPQPTVSIALSSNKPKVSWDKVSGAVEYKVYRATSKDGSYSLVKTTTSLNWKDTTAASGKTYYYKVVAVADHSSANSAYSSVVSIKSK